MSRRYEWEREVAVQAVREAARLCRAVAAEISPDVLAKKDKSPVTVADFGSQALIARALAEAFPDDPIIAEEDSAELRQPENAAILDQVLRHVRAVRAGVDASETAGLDAGEVCRWIDRGGTSAVSRPVLDARPDRRHQGLPPRRAVRRRAGAGRSTAQVAVAALACPGLDAGCRRRATAKRAFSPCGARGRLSCAERAGGGPAARAVRVSDRDDPAAARFCESVESGHSAHGDAASVAARLGITAAPLRMDSQAKYAVVARGEADIYLRLPTRADYREKIWDHAAGALIVAEAGGIVTDIHGRPLEFHHGRELAANRGVIVTNGRLHDRVLEAIRELGIGRSSQGRRSGEWRIRDRGFRIRTASDEIIG